MSMRTFLSFALVLFIIAWSSSQVASQSIIQEPTTEPAGSISEVVATSDIKWGPLNPARGDKGPKAGTLWGDRTGSGPSGFLVKFVDRFSSPPHIHNITYRAVVISGLIYNGDPNAKEVWMPKGSVWTQPAGEVHITAADGHNNLVYVEIEEGPYLVRPTEEAFDNGERPVNVDVSNIVWLDASDITWIDQTTKPAFTHGPKLVFLWGMPQDDQLSGSLVKLPVGFSGKIRSRGSTFRAVVIQGRPQYRMPGETDVRTLAPGSYFGSTGKSVHQVSCEAGEECIVYVRMKGKFDVIQEPPKK
ncbi:MAG: hypothetical protein NPIRA01_28360 [Nitrospirales bacterium]|nr:MAG: hypothetical protein NPIRA01_28360 [Nitrospirales bacterium]